MAKNLRKALLGTELLHPNDYIAAIELKGRDVTLTIAKVERKELKMAGGEKDMCAVVHFRETPKMLILNKTNASSLVVLYGSQANDWTDKRVTIYPTKVPCGRETVDAIRIREKVPPAKGAAPSKAPDPAPDEADTGRPIERGESVSESDIEF